MNKFFGIKGVFDIIKKDGQGNIIDSYHFENLVLNSGLDLVGKYPHSTEYLNDCFLGSGNSEPNVNQIALDGMIARSNNKTSSSNDRVLTDDETAIVYKRIYRFGENEANGNISEIGIGTMQSNKEVLFCRTLVKDGNNKPTTITKLQGEILEVIYTLKVVVDATDSTGTVTIGDKQYRYIARPSRKDVNTYYTAYLRGGNISNIDNTAGGENAIVRGGFGAYENGSHTLNYSVHASIDQGNFKNGVRSVVFRGVFNMWYQVQFNAVDNDGAIPKNNTQRLTITFEQSWGRA